MTSETRESLRAMARELERLAGTLKCSGRTETAFILDVARMAVDEELYGAGAALLAQFGAMHENSPPIAHSPAIAQS
jgi:hypothetical protein